jgi:predicted amidohydrolase
MTAVRFAAVQMTSGDDVDVNLRTAGELLDRAAGAGAVLAVLPENFARIGAHEPYRSELAEADGSGPLQAFLADAAKRTGMWIVGGTIPVASDDSKRPFAACLVYDSTGRRVGRYDKIHLFDVDIPDDRSHSGAGENYRESGNTQAGRKPLVIGTPWGGLGIAVCYDLRFPELFRSLSQNGMDFLALPSAFAVATGQAHWHALVRARAIENLCYVVAAAQTGEHAAGRRTYGHSLIVGPWGEVLAGDMASVCSDKIGYISAAIDIDRLQDLRRQFPVLSHRQLGATEPEA